MAVHQLTRVDESKREQAVYPAAGELPDGWLGPQAVAGGGFVQWIEAGIMSLRREIAARIFPLDPRARQFADVILRGAGAMLAPIAAIEEPLAYYRFHGANIGNTARRFDIDAALEWRRRDLEELRHAYEALDRWARRELDGVSLPSFETTRPSLERRYVIARLAGEPRAEANRLRSALLAIPQSMSPTLRAFYTLGPLLPRRVFKAGLEVVYGQGRVKATAAGAKRYLRRAR